MPQGPTITAIRPTRRDPSRSTIRVGRRVVATLYQRHIDALGLAAGQAWDDALAERVQNVADDDEAMRKALNRLNRRAMSRAELDRKLREQGFEPPVRQRVLDELAELNYLDDAAFARMLVNDLLMRRPAGPRLLRQKLMQKGVPRELIEPAIQQAMEGQDQLDAAVSLLEKKWPSVRELDPLKRKRRLLGLLQRRGFELDTIHRAMSQFEQDLDDASDC